jgi:hypothetical protein
MFVASRLLPLASRLLDLTLPLTPMSTNILEINCLLHDDEDPQEHLFSIEVEPSCSVTKLKDLIKAKKLPKADFTADELILWQVSIPHTSENLAARLKEIRLDDSDNTVRRLAPALRLSSFFSDEHPLVDGNVHVLVQQPVSGESLRSSFNKSVLIF